MGKGDERGPAILAILASVPALHAPPILQILNPQISHPQSSAPFAPPRGSSTIASIDPVDRTRKHRTTQGGPDDEK
jgi:hypothetical protein